MGAYTCKRWTKVSAIKQMLVLSNEVVKMHGIPEFCASNVCDSNVPFCRPINSRGPRAHMAVSGDGKMTMMMTSVPLMFPR